MKWFTETFMRSIDDKIAERNKSFLWISEKQTQICKRYMTPQSVNDGWYIVIGNYQYTLQEFKDYGKITRCDRRIGIR